MYTYVHLYIYIYIHIEYVFTFTYICAACGFQIGFIQSKSIRHIWSLGDATLRCEPTKSWVDLEGYHGYTVILE